MPQLDQLTEAGKEELALALLLWKDFKCDGKFDIEVTRQVLAFAEMLGVKSQFEALMPKLPPMKITPR
jgi:hypothetical protein